MRERERERDRAARKMIFKNASNAARRGPGADLFKDTHVHKFKC